MAYDFVAGDSGSTLQVTCVDQDGTAISLTGNTVKLYWTFNDGDTHSGAMTVTDAANGVCTYTFTASDAKNQLQAGTMKVEVEITTTSGGAVKTSMTELTYQVRARTNEGAG